MAKISMKLITYNEEFFLPHSLAVVLPYIDELVVVDGSPDGPSTDCTLDILAEFSNRFPGKMKIFTGIYRNHDSSWDEMTQANETLKHITGDYLMLHHADIIYDHKDMENIVKAVERFPNKLVYYCDMIEFFYDMMHVRLYPNTCEVFCPKPLTGDVPMLSMKLKPRYVGNAIMTHEHYTTHDTLFMPHVRRYHFGWVKPFAKQVEKHIKYMKHVRKQPEILELGEDGIRKWAIEHVLSYATDPSMHDYYGEYPEIVEKLSLWNMSSMDGYDENTIC